MKLKFDIIFLDVEMGNFNGIKVAEKLHSINENCLIFFVTNYEVYMDTALNQHAFRFWIKPLVKSRLVYGIKSAMNELEASCKYITVIVNSTNIKIIVNDIVYIYSENRKTYIVTRRGNIATTSTLKSVIEQLSEYDGFCKSHGSFYVNLKICC